MRNRKSLFSKTLIVIFLVLFVLCFLGCEENNKDEYIEDYKIYVSDCDYDIFNNNKITIGMWVTPNDTLRSDEIYREISECGINLINGFSSSDDTKEDIIEVLGYCEKYNLKYLVASKEIENNILAYIKSNNDTEKENLINASMDYLSEFSEYKAFKGVIFLDEPDSSKFNALGKFYEAFRDRFPDKIAYVNLFPYEVTSSTGFSTYDNYLETWIKTTKTSFLSYDSYPLILYDKSEYGYEAESSMYYYGLDIARTVTNNYKIPFWTFVQTESIVHSNQIPKREPSREDFRWNIFSNLAFGAKGIQYFTLIPPKSLDYGDGIYTRSGEKTSRYYYSKELVEEISSFEGLLLNSTCVGVMIDDYRRNGYEIYTSPLESYGPIKSVEGDRYLIGCFSNALDGHKSILITPTTPRDDVSIKINLYKNIKTVNAYINGVKTTLEVNDGVLELSILKGNAVYIYFD